MSLTLSSDTDSDNAAVDALNEIQERLAEVLVELSLSRASDTAAIAIMSSLEHLGRQVDSARVTSAHDLSQDGLYRLVGGLTPLDRGIMEKYWAATIASTRPVFVSEDGVPVAEAAESGESGAGSMTAVVSIDSRPAGEKRADVLRALVVAAARDTGAATMGGGAPTVVVHVNAADLESGTGVGWIDGLDAPLSLATVTDLMSVSSVEPVVFDKNGTVVQVGSVANRRRRLFDHLQRRAITARDGGCVVPGCTVPAYYCELNHVVPYSEGGDTLISNGCCACWWHHVSMGTPGGWQVRMVNGLPQVKAPHWLDPIGTWRAPQKHRATLPSSRD